MGEDRTTASSDKPLIKQRVVNRTAGPHSRKRRELNMGVDIKQVRALDTYFAKMYICNTHNNFVPLRTKNQKETAMKRTFVILAALLALSSVALAASALPDYQKDGTLTATMLCDNGKTTVKGYANDGWHVIEIRTVAGEVFADMNRTAFFMQSAGSKEMKSGLTHEEWDEALAEKSESAFNRLHGGPHDCVKQ